MAVLGEIRVLKMGLISEILKNADFVSIQSFFESESLSKKLLKFNRFLVSIFQNPVRSGKKGTFSKKKSIFQKISFFSKKFLREVIER